MQSVFIYIRRILTSLDAFKGKIIAMAMHMMLHLLPDDSAS